MYFTEDELRLVVAWARWRTARSLGIIGDDDLLVPVDAVAAISASKGHLDALQELADAYGAWYGFHLGVFRAGRSGSMTPAEHAELDGLIDRRDRAKQALVDLTPL